MEDGVYIEMLINNIEQEAEDKVRVLKLIQKARESQNGFVPDWEGATYYKHSLYFDSACKKVRTISVQTFDIAPTFGYWEDESVCEQFIDDNHEELLWFFTEYRRRENGSIHKRRTIMTKKNAWKVEPKLIDRFLDVLADNDFKWSTGHRANEFKPTCSEGETTLFFEELPKTLEYMRYSTYLNEEDEEHNITEVTEELLEDMEDEGKVITIVYDDQVNHPSHYNHGEPATIEIIRMVLSEEEYRGYLKGNILKYRERAPYKGNAEEDYVKAKWYFDELMTIGF